MKSLYLNILGKSGLEKIYANDVVDCTNFPFIFPSLLRCVQIRESNFREVIILVLIKLRESKKHRIEDPGCLSQQH